MGKYGVHSDDPQQELAPGELSQAINIDLTQGIIQKAAGSRKWNATALPDGIAQAISWSPDGVSQRVAASCKNGKLYQFKNAYRYSELTATDGAVLKPGPQGHFCPIGRVTALHKRKLVYFSGNDAPRVMQDGETTHRPMTKPATDWTSNSYPTFGIVHRERLFTIGADPHTILASTIADQEDFQTLPGGPATDYVLPFVVFPGEGERFVTGWVFRGKLFMAKYPSGVYMLVDDDADYNNWYFKKISGSIGCASGHSSLETTDDMYLANQHGTVTSLVAAFQLGDVKLTDVISTMRAEQFVTENLNRAVHSCRYAVFHKDSKVAYFSYAAHDSATANRILALDFNNQRAKLHLISKDSLNSLLLLKGNEGRDVPAYTADDGFIYTMDASDRDVGGNAFEFEFRLPQTGLGFKGNKLFDFLEVEAEHTGRWKLYCDVFLDDTFSETVNFDMSQGAVLRANVLDADCFQLDKDRLMGRQTRSQRKQLHGRGERISLRFYSTNSTDQNFRICKIILNVRAGNEDQTGK
jgi:hypothetical protein